VGDLADYVEDPIVDASVRERLLAELNDLREQLTHAKHRS